MKRNGKKMKWFMRQKEAGKRSRSAVLLSALFVLALPFTALAEGGTWQQEGDIWYLLAQDGRRMTGWQKEDGVWYYMNEAGAMQTGWLREGGRWYYLKPSGAMQNTMLYEDDTQYAFHTDGSLAGVRQKKNCGGGAYTIGFYGEEQQDLADALNELKNEEFDGDEEEDYYEDDKINYDKDASYVINGTLQAIAEHRLELARSRGYGSGRIPDEGTLSDYLKEIGYQSGRRVMEVYLMNCDDATEAEEKLLRNHDSDEKKRTDRAIYYKEMGIAHEKVGEKDYYMVVFMR
ncbi:MAG: cell surface protein [Clostridiaceae bacterium]|nr:cell surface protein [Clostridiaceae bacterium]